MKKLLVIILLFLLPFTTGCWDKVEIEQRVFVTKIGIDKNENEEGINKMTVTYQYPNINNIGKDSGGGSSNFLITTESSSVFQAGRQFMTKVPFPFYYKHLKVVILGNEFLKEENLIRVVLDELNRDTKINKRVRILAADRTAKEIMEASFNKEQRTEGTIYATVRDNRNTSSYTTKSLADIVTDFDIAGVTLIPRISLDEKGSFVVSGGCILKNYHFLDWIDPVENKVVNLINGDMVIETIDVIYEQNLISYAISETETRRDIKVDDKITADINVQVEGYLQGYTLSDKSSIENDEIIMNMEKAIESEMMKAARRTISHMKEVKADLIGIGEHISKYHPKEWDKIENDWDDIFSEVEINLNIDVKIRRIGLTR